MSQLLGYRKELDGVRAIAVLAVIIYHAELSFFGVSILPGGFLGVDVFFVLSGYLITGILSERRPSLTDFYRSRFDRIYPALVLVLAVSCVFAYFWMLPRDIVPFSKSLKGALGFYSNYVFMFEDSYVSDSSHYKPLLHTWSLGVEWQFYVVFPLVVYWVVKALDWSIETFFALLLMASFFYCMHLMSINSAHAFYSSVARVWELLAGGLVYFLSTKSKHTDYSELLSSLGLALIMYSFFFFKDSDNHPGFISLVAVMGVSLLILHVSPAATLYRVLSSKVFVFLGVTSYSLYLFHQPILAFYRIVYGPITLPVFVLLFMLMVMCSYLSWRFYESPMRRSRKLSKYVLLLILSILVFTFGNWMINTEGYPKRLPDTVLAALKNISSPEELRLGSGTVGQEFDGRKILTCFGRTPETACRFGKTSPRVILLGDSYSGVFAYSLKEAVGDSLVALHYPQCTILSDPIWFGTRPECWEINKQRWKLLESIPPSTIVIGANFSHFYKAKRSAESFVSGSSNTSDAVDPELVYSSFARSVSKLDELGHKIIVLLQPPVPGMNVNKEMQRRIAKRQWNFKDEYGGTPTVEIDKDVRASLSSIKNITFVDINKRMCHAGSCLRFASSGALYNNGDHLSYLGVQMFISQIMSNVR